MEMTNEKTRQKALQGTSKFIAFLDECGDHSLEKIDQDFPLFVLSSVVVERENYENKIIPGFNKLKLKYWDHEGVNLHSRDIRKAEGPFSILENAVRRGQFLSNLTSLIEDLPYTLFIVGIDKIKHKERYGDRATNPYELALTFTFERILNFLESEGQGHLPVIAEARGKNEDRDLEAAFYKLLTAGTFYNKPDRFNKLTCPLLFQDKRKNIIGLQLADLCAYPSARQILKPAQKNRAFDVIQRHLYNGGTVKGWKVFP